MPPTQRPSITKRNREQALREKREQKEQRRAERAVERQKRAAAVADGEDPDLAGIVPGPQPRPDDE